MPKLAKVLIANRGEIAVRVIRACDLLGIKTVAIYSEPDTSDLHVELADEAYCVGKAAPSASYLRADQILEVATEAGADGVHPGYGFLAENALFAAKCEAAGLVFVGPRPETITAMGEKTSARDLARQASVPLVPATDAHPDEQLLVDALGLELPLMVKAVCGGGGKGMRLVHNMADLPTELALARLEAQRAFGDDRLYVEQALVRPRHVEVQVFGDGQGQVIHIGERDCSIQRRHQKIVEETPAPNLSPKTRAAMHTCATRLASHISYRGAGTVEFLVVGDHFYFLEMNTRLQVEHPVSEAVSQLDLVVAQLRVAAGEPLWLSQDDVVLRGHAIECRVCAENPANGFTPATGTLGLWSHPQLPHTRLDTGFRGGDEISPHYDSLLAKCIAWGEDRGQAVDRLRLALAELKILGVQTNTGFVADVLAHPAFRAGQVHTHFLDDHFDLWLPRAPSLEAAALAGLTEHLRANTAASGPGAPDHATDLFSPWQGPHRIAIPAGPQGRGGAV